MQPNESDAEPLHPALKRHRERAELKIQSTKREDRVEMFEVLTAFRDEHAKQRNKSNRWWQRLPRFEGFGRFWPRLMIAGGVAAALVLGLFLYGPSLKSLLYRPNAAIISGRPIAIAFAALGRGNQPPVGAYPLAGEFVMELDLPAERVRFIEGALSYDSFIEGAPSYAGKLVEQKGGLPGVASFTFEVRGKSSSGTAVVITGLLKLTGSQPNKLPETAQEILSAHIAAAVRWGNQQTNVDRLFLP